MNEKSVILAAIVLLLIGGIFYVAVPEAGVTGQFFGFRFLESEPLSAQPILAQEVPREREPIVRESSDVEHLQNSISAISRTPSDKLYKEFSSILTVSDAITLRRLENLDFSYGPAIEVLSSQGISEQTRLNSLTKFQAATIYDYLFYPNTLKTEFGLDFSNGDSSECVISPDKDDSKTQITGYTIYSGAPLNGNGDPFLRDSSNPDINGDRAWKTKSGYVDQGGSSTCAVFSWFNSNLDAIKNYYYEPPSNEDKFFSSYMECVTSKYEHNKENRGALKKLWLNFLGVDPYALDDDQIKDCKERAMKEIGVEIEFKDFDFWPDCKKIAEALAKEGGAATASMRLNGGAHRTEIVSLNCDEDGGKAEFRDPNQPEIIIEVTLDRIGMITDVNVNDDHQNEDGTVTHADPGDHADRQKAAGEMYNGGKIESVTTESTKKSS